MGSHRKAKQHKAVATVGTVGIAGAAALTAAAPSHAAPVTIWDKVASCESSGDWSINTHNGYYGGLQFTSSTWAAYGGHVYAPEANQATKSQQITIAEKVLASQGPGAWPVCSVKAGLTAGGPAPRLSVRSAPRVAPQAVPAPSRTAVSAGARAVAFAREQIGVHYLWGGTTSAGFDCSGLVYASWKHAGVSLPRTADEMWHHLPHTSLSSLRAGDIVAFGYSSGYADHVGIYAGGGMLIDTSSHRPGGGVGIASLSGRTGGGAWHALGAVRPVGRTSYVTHKAAAPKHVPGWARQHTEAAPAVQQTGAVTHTVVPGDTLSHIARLYDVQGGWAAIFQANLPLITKWAKEHGDAADGHWIFPGQVIRIPGPRKV